MRPILPARCIARPTAPTPRIALFAVLLLAPRVLLSAQSYSISEFIFLPPQFHVGDRVELRFTLSNIAGNATVEDIQEPQQIDQPFWGSVHEIRIVPNAEQNEVDVRLYFTSYYTGTQTIPPIDLGVISLSDLSIFVSSLLDQNELEASSGQLLLPGTQIILIILALLLVLVLFFLVPIISVLQKYAQALLSQYRRALPYRTVRRDLRELTSKAGLMDGRSFYIELLILVRNYLHGRIHIDARSATTGELEATLKQSIEDRKDRDFIIQLFHEGDLVKFASEPSSLRSRMKHIEQLQQVLSHIESKAQDKSSEESEADSQ